MTTTRNVVMVHVDTQREADEAGCARMWVERPDGPTHMMELELDSTGHFWLRIIDPPTQPRVVKQIHEGYLFTDGLTFEDVMANMRRTSLPERQDES